MSEIFIESDINFDLESRVKVAPLSNREIYVIRLKPTAALKKNLKWPDIEKDQADVFFKREEAKVIFPPLHISFGFFAA